MRKSTAAHDRIKELLTAWAGWQFDGCGNGWPSKVSFVTERVQCDNRQADHREMPDDVQRVDEEIKKLAPGFVRIVALEYCDRRPQKTKAALLNMPREVFSVRLRFIHEQLSFAMWGDIREAA